jgi:hypothetical protein
MLGGLKVTALAAGSYGESVALAIQQAGNSIVTTIANPHFGSGDLTVTIPSGTTEAQLIAALQRDPVFSAVALIEQAVNFGWTLALNCTWFTIQYGGQVTPRINSIGLTAGALQAALQALTSIGSGNCTVTGPTQGPFTILLGGTITSPTDLTIQPGPGDATLLPGAAPVTLISKTALVATGGLQQHLADRLKITTWDDRDEKVTSQPAGLIWIFDAKIKTQTVQQGGENQWTGELRVGIYLKLAMSLQQQLIVMDLYRAALFAAVSLFVDQTDELRSIDLPGFTYGNELTPAAVGTVREAGDCQVIGSFPLAWTEPNGLDAAAGVPFQAFQFGLWRQPDDEPPGGPGAVLDVILRVDQ